MAAQLEDDDIFLIRDDGSSDRTMSLLRSYRDKIPQIRLLDNDRRNVGPIASFGWLLQYVNDHPELHQVPDPLIFLCDQDDVWKPGKLTMFKAAYQGMCAAKHERELLIHSDLMVVDSKLEVLHASFFSSQGINVEKNSFFQLVVGNTVTGCAAAINLPLLRRAVPMSGQAIMHDWWLALVAAMFGRIVSLKESTVLYRQHGGNVIGAKPLQSLGFKQKFRKLFSLKKNPDITAVAMQADGFRKRYSQELSIIQRFYLVSVVLFCRPALPFLYYVWARLLYPVFNGIVQK
ncbi:glycosyltransferase [Simiduia sp. 21SJ11W-1]|uniref:glycosyltransferase n=1 Tax=Simiduia sp. 21SJ11W-1 TaxID=2909669 RepID=UPI00209C7E0F|nr:glycosyltransferase [Simiduia sp. 21SJ11W-1]UTA49547.1 glycosyltransferase [Simiduia sp. 21SJ11W-1]